MRKKLILLDVLLIFITLLSVTLVFWFQTDNYFNKAIIREGELQLHYLAENFRNQISNGTLVEENFVNDYSTDDLDLYILDSGTNVVVNSQDVSDNGLIYHYKKDVIKVFNGNDGALAHYFDNKTDAIYLTERIDMPEYSGYLRIAIVNNMFSGFKPELTQIMLLMLFAGIVISVITAYLFTRRVMKPVDELTQAAITIARGDYEQKIYIDSDDQIGDLASAFNVMTTTLRNNINKLKQSNSDFEAVIDSIQDGVIALDLSYRIFRYNEKVRKIFNVNEDLLGRKVYDIYRTPQIFDLIDNAVATHSYQEDEVVLRDLGKTVKLYTNPIFDVNHGNGEPELVGVLLVIRDVSKVRKLEVIRRDFVSNVTHELKTPLTSIRGFVEALKSGAVNDEKLAYRFLDIIEIEAERLSDLINDILSLSEIENLTQDKNFEVFNLKSLIDEIIVLVEQKAVDKGLMLEIDCSSDISCNCNRNRIKQVILNLVDNGIKYTEHGSVKIKCIILDGELIVKIEDTGFGIENKHLDRIFERFYRVDKGRSRKMGGTGLGLSIVKHIVELYNGRIEVTSQEGTGSQFSVYLPILNK